MTTTTTVKQDAAAGWRVTETTTEQQSRDLAGYRPEPCRVARLSHQRSGLSLWVSRYPDETCWLADAVFTAEGPVFNHGTGARNTGKRTLEPGLAALLDERA